MTDGLYYIWMDCLKEFQEDYIDDYYKQITEYKNKLLDIGYYGEVRVDIIGMGSVDDFKVIGGVVHICGGEYHIHDTIKNIEFEVNLNEEKDMIIFCLKDYFILNFSDYPCILYSPNIYNEHIKNIKANKIKELKEMKER